MRQEQSQLLEEKEELQKQNESLIKEKKKLEKDLQAKKEAKAKVAKAKAPVRVASAKANCKDYLPLLKKYPWDVNTAMMVMSKESGCRANAVSPTNDHGLFQLHNQRVYDPAQNIAIAYKKYRAGRIGSNNWSAWYAVCTPGNSPQPKYAGVHCQ
jgi:hypothetical protein